MTAIRGRSGLGRFAAVLAAAATVTAGAVGLVIGGPSQSAFAAPFQCTSSFFWVQDAQLFEGSPLNTGFAEAVGPVNPTGTYNALAFNQQDGLLYAIGSTGTAIDQQLVTIDDNGTVTPHGVPTGLPAGIWVYGAFDDDGNYWVGAATTTSTPPLYRRIDIAANTVVQTLDPAPAAPGYYPPDIVWRSGSIVQLVVPTPTSPPVIRTLDTTTGAWTDAVSNGVTLRAVFASASMWISSDDRLFIATRLGVIMELVGWKSDGWSLVERQPSVANVLNGDGANCAAAPAPFGIRAADDDYSSTPIPAEAGGAVGGHLGQ